ncbi:MAG: polyribonucleotide nucleotidyltransferase [Candidatus Babeliales bacterium]
MVKKFRFDEFDYEIELGKVARFANGAVWLKQGGTVVLATAVAAPSKDFPGFFPLSVDYRELFSAAGKIPGGYYKREGRPSDKEILTMRFIDRTVRPFFPEDYFDAVQLIATVYSVDKEHAPNINALIASSLAITLSDIPFLGPVAAVDMFYINGTWKVNPLYQESKEATAHFTVSGTQEGICMVEGWAEEITEKEFIDVLFQAHSYIKRLVEWQLEIKQEMGRTKQPINNLFDWDEWSTKAEQYLTSDKVEQAYIADKVERSAYLDQLRKAFLEEHSATIIEKALPKEAIAYIFNSVLKECLTEIIFVRKKRIDGRNLDEVRPITVEVGILPGTHGSALFTRGKTQALVSVTLGSGQDEQKMEGVMEDDPISGHFMVHYNFPPFSVGEVRPLRGPGRRELGHGYLAQSAQKRMLPNKESFPYTVRIVAEMLESDGSTSMATVCGTTMALMYAGVEIKAPVSGVAMGLLQNKKGEFLVLTDILGFEDMFGLMDFKVAGTEKGITAVQMDIKYQGGLERSIFEGALEQARIARLHILSIMQQVMNKPNAELSDLVPKLSTVKVPVDKIGAVIGSGGKTIRAITETTKTEIDIEPDGLIKIFGGQDALTSYAISWVRLLVGQIEKGTQFNGIVRRVADFGLIVSLVPEKDGMLHKSQFSKELQRSFAQKYKVNDPIEVEIADYDPVTDRIQLKPVKTD